jgi:FkbM family methyltransferase
LPTASSLKNLAKRLFNAFGLEIRKTPAASAPERASMRGALHQLSSLGFKPATVIDAGVATQTLELYEAFPSASILLIEPLAEFEPFLQKICAAYKAQYVLAAAGQSPGSATFHVHADKVSSSLLHEVEGPSVDGTPRTVPVVSIDQQCAEKNLPGPYLIKLDVQGAELQVLSGASRTLQHTEVVMLEGTLFATMIGGPQLHDLILYMKGLGFVLYDLYPILYRPLDGALAQVDLLFVREHGPFRQSHAYATPEQRKLLDRQLDPLFAEASKDRR